MTKKWFAMLLALVLCMLMGTAFAQDYEIKDGTLYVYGDLPQLPEGYYDLIQIDDRQAVLSLPPEQEVFQDVINRGKIYSGTFRGKVTNYQEIMGGTFFGDVACDNRGTIENGTFHAAVTSGEDCEIRGGTFTETSEVNNSLRSEIIGGQFSGKVFNGNTGIGGREGIISGGTFTETSEVTIGRKGIVSGGVFNGKVYYLIVVKIDISKNNGTVIASVDGTNADRAMAEKTVCLTVTPEAGYELDTLAVTTEDGNDVALNKVGDLDFRFTMPESVVYVTASFRACAAAPLPPETGDSSTLMLWLALSMLSAAGVLLMRKKAYGR